MSNGLHVKFGDDDDTCITIYNVYKKIFSKINGFTNSQSVEIFFMSKINVQI